MKERMAHTENQRHVERETDRSRDTRTKLSRGRTLRDIERWRKNAHRYQHRERQRQNWRCIKRPEVQHRQRQGAGPGWQGLQTLVGDAHRGHWGLSSTRNSPFLHVAKKIEAFSFISSGILASTACRSPRCSDAGNSDRLGPGPLPAKNLSSGKDSPPWGRKQN